MLLYHFSEEPGITRFEPRSPLARPEVAPLVWAIDEWHAPMYFLPRECPRACFWPGPQTTPKDRARWFTGIDARMVIAIESAWLEALRSTTLYRYTMPGATFTSSDDNSGHWTSRVPVTPTAVQPVGDLLSALAAADVELRLIASLVGHWREVVQSTLSFSGTRLRNATGFTDEIMTELNALIERSTAGRTRQASNA
jgi:hypothetical protein